MMPEPILFEYVVIRVVPRVEREEFMNVGVALYAGSRKYVRVLYCADEGRLQALCPGIDVAEIREYLCSFERICKGGKMAGPIGALPVAQRFRWLSATRSTVMQMSKVHSGFCYDPDAQLQHLYSQLVL